ncbi:hypothetical protein D3C80_1823290 [compost metagenome]
MDLTRSASPSEAAKREFRGQNPALCPYDCECPSNLRFAPDSAETHQIDVLSDASRSSYRTLNPDKKPCGDYLLDARLFAKDTAFFPLPDLRPYPLSEYNRFRF